MNAQRMFSCMSDPLVSVVIASYNMGQYLPLAVESILAQTYKNLELIVIDDGSTDDTEKTIQPLLVDARLTYIRQENQGQPKAKNNGIANCKGDFIAFCDGDDLWAPDKLEVQMPMFERAEVGIVYSEVSYIDEHNNRYDKEAPYERFEGKVTEQLLIKNFVPFGTSVFRKACIEQSGIFNDSFKMGIDWDLWLRYSLNWEFAFTPAKTYVYREWSGQMSKNMEGRYFYAFKILGGFLAEHGELVSKAVIRQSWADMHVSRGISLARTKHLFKDPLKDIIKGISINPFALYGWKALIKLLLGRA